MRVKINPNAVREHSVFLEEKSEEFDRLKDDLIKKVDASVEYWKGKDADIYRERASSYFKGLEQVSKIIREYSVLFKKSSDNHENLDRSFANNIKNIIE